MIISITPLKAPVEEQVPGNRLHCIKAHAHADRGDFYQDAKSDSGNYAAASETAGIDHHERKNHKRAWPIRIQ
jgi:hypothetical protein